VAIVKTLVQLAHPPGLTVTAECVETTDQPAGLRRIGCATGQDWLYSRAVVPNMIDEIHHVRPRRVGQCLIRRPAPRCG
jgi:EAL domain-containing protein (putative c-di-GMP-specific phosphodiesterase class I)